MADTFYRSFRERRPTAFGGGARRRYAAGLLWADRLLALAAPSRLAPSQASRSGCWAIAGRFDTVRLVCAFQPVSAKSRHYAPPSLRSGPPGDQAARCGSESSYGRQRAQHPHD